MLLILNGCGGGNNPQPAAPQSTYENSPAASMIIGPEGGSFEVTAPDNPAYGARIEVPKGALDKTEQIGISYNEDPANLPKAYTIAGNSIVLNPEGLTFLKPIVVTIPYKDLNNDGYIDGTHIPEKSVGALYVDNTADKLEVFKVTNRSTDKNTVTISTNHFSTYLSYVEESTTPSPTPDPVPDPATQYISGEHFLADPTYTHDNNGIVTLIRLQAPNSYLTVHRKTNGLTAKLDSHLTYMETGFPCAMAVDHTSCTFDAAGFYPKIKNSGDAALWDWNCEFVSEHTQLRHYEVHDDSMSVESASKIYCEISAADANSVKINWTINANTEIGYTTDMLAIRLWANYR